MPRIESLISSRMAVLRTSSRRTKNGQIIAPPSRIFFHYLEIAADSIAVIVTPNRNLYFTDGRITTVSSGFPYFTFKSCVGWT